ncbi:hypothetical protein D3C84_864100 [compost metagenome]
MLSVGKPQREERFIGALLKETLSRLYARISSILVNSGICLLPGRIPLQLRSPLTVQLQSPVFTTVLAGQHHT